MSPNSKEGESNLLLVKIKRSYVKKMKEAKCV